MVINLLVSLALAVAPATGGLSGRVTYAGSASAAEPIDMSAYGHAGKPVRIRTELIQTLLGSGFLPVISPVARNATAVHGAALNVNGDDAAAAIAAAMNAELWMIADVAGVLSAEKKVLASLDIAQTEELVTSGVVNKGMHAKLEAGFSALEHGASAVRIAGLEAVMNPEGKHGTLLTASM